MDIYFPNVIWMRQIEFATISYIFKWTYTEVYEEIGQNPGDVLVKKEINVQPSLNASVSLNNKTDNFN